MLIASRWRAIFAAFAYNLQSLIHDEARLMKALSLQAKKAYCAKTRRSNYVASLRLEGYEVVPDLADRELPSREAAVQAHRKQG